MSEGIEMAKAYVQIVPSAQGIRAALTDVFGEETDGLGEKTGQSIGAQLVGTIKKVVAAAGIGKLVSDSLNLGGALQQSIGGIETLFGAGGRSIEEYAQSVGKSVDEVKDEYASLMQSQQIVFDNAKQAYKTVGLSANDYMEQTTSFAASLLSSVSQDTNAAAQLANMAMVDMADNANKMGTDMQDIQNAYQGFAKQNYTMLDNLKLGYGGTQAEMQRLLKDAEKISGVKYDLGNLADMYSAIHVIQQEMDITGTTAKEASTTLTGSFASMKAAAENVLADWSTGADLTEPLQALADTAQTFLEGNLLPMISNMLQGIPQLVYTLVPTILQSGTDLLNSLAEGFAQGIPDFLSNALPELLSFTEELRANAGSFVDAGLNMITQLVNGLIAGLPDLIAYVPGGGYRQGGARPAGELEEDFAGRALGHFSRQLAEHRQEPAHPHRKRRQEHGLQPAGGLQGRLFQRPEVAVGTARKIVPAGQNGHPELHQRPDRYRVGGHCCYSRPRPGRDRQRRRFRPE